MQKGIGNEFLQKTKYHRKKMTGGKLDWIQQPDLYKTYPTSKVIKLPSPRRGDKISLDAALHDRRSIRSFSAQPLDQQQLSYLLWASTGIQRKEQTYAFRTAPSAGALYPIETYLVVNNLVDLDPGIYHYAIRNHQLEELQTGDFGQAVSQAALEQSMCANAPVVFIWTAIFNRSKWKYGQRAYRYIFLDAGHIAENLALAATGMKLGSCHIGALFDEEINSIIEVDGVEESVIYMTVVGYPR